MRYLILISIIFLSSCYNYDVDIEYNNESCLNYEVAEILIEDFQNIRIVTESLDTTYSMTNSPIRFNFFPTENKVEITSKGDWILMETKEVLVDNCNLNWVSVDYINQYKMILNLNEICWNSTIGSGSGYFLTFINFCEI